jgi:hypothetical protein
MALTRTNWPDVDDVVALNADTEVMRYLDHGRPMTPARVLHNSAWGLMVAFTATSCPVLVNSYLLGDSGILITFGAAAGAVLVGRMMPRGGKARPDPNPPVLEPVPSITATAASRQV